MARHFLWSHGASASNDQVWDTTDIDGDGKPDLVVTGEFESGVAPDVYNLGRAGDSPHWKVYRNTGTAFESQAKDWALPVGGRRDRGYWFTHEYWGQSKKIGDDDWDLLDVTGDGRPELVRLATVIEDPLSPGGPYTIPRVQGYGASPHWLVYQNVP